MSESQKAYECTACGLHYTDQADAEACNTFCTQHNACSLEITKHAVENQAGNQS